MDAHSVPAKYDPNRLLNVLIERLRLASDRELAQKLQVSYKLLAKLRSGDLTISPSMLLWMAECADTSIEELRSILGDRRARGRLRYPLAA